MCNVKTVFLLLTISLGLAGEYEPLEHGLVEELTDEEVASIRAWAENSKTRLKNLLEDLEGIGSRRQKLLLIEGSVRQIVLASSHKKNELFLRYALNPGTLSFGTFRARGGRGNRY